MQTAVWGGHGHASGSGEPGAAKPAAAVEGSFAISDHNGPHAHMIAADPRGKYVFSTDLGLDRIYQYRFDDQTGKLTPNDPPFISASSKGAGPRHFVFTPKGDALWLINEEASTLTHYTLDARGRLQEGKTLSALPHGYKGTSFLPPGWRSVPMANSCMWLTVCITASGTLP